jgi:hypothetical protein
VKTYPFKNPPPRGGKAKGSASMTEKLQHNVSGFRSACSSWCQKVLGYLPPTQLIYHRIFLAVVLGGWATQSPISQEFF